jgi:PAS domain S-box-containing protein
MNYKLIDQILREPPTISHFKYITIDATGCILESAEGAEKFADRPELIQPSHDIREGFPELVGLEKIFRQVLLGEKEFYEIKGIDRSKNQSPLYFDLYLLKDENELTHKSHLVLLIKDVTDSMVSQQTVFQKIHEANLLLRSLEIYKNYVNGIISSIADILIVTTESGIIKTINQAAVNLFGYRESELINQHLSILIGNNKFNFSKKEDLTTDLTQLRWEALEIKCLTKNQAEILISFSCSLVLTEVQDIYDFVYVGRDITKQRKAEESIAQLNETLTQKVEERTQELQQTIKQLEKEIGERKRTEQALQQEREFLNALLNHLGDGIVACDATGKITLFNQVTQQFYGFASPIPCPDTWSEYAQLYLPDQQHPLPAEDTPIARTYRGETLNQVEIVLVPKQGKPRYLLASGQPIIDAQGQRLGAVVAMQDITQRQQAETALQNILAGTASVTGEEFFPVLVRHICTALGVRYAGINQTIEHQPHHVQVLAFWANHQMIEPFVMDISGTACEQVKQQQGLVYYSANLHQHFPSRPDSIPPDAVCYLGLPLLDTQQQVIGTLCIYHDQPLEDLQQAQSILSIFAARGAAELQRLRAETALRRAHDELEVRVSQRTQELWQTNQSLAAEIAQRQEVEVQMQTRERYLAALVDIQRWLLANRNWGNYDQILQTLGEAAGASRVCLFENQLDVTGSLQMILRSQWCVPEIASQFDPFSSLPSFIYEETYPRWATTLATGTVIAGTLADFPPSERQLLASQGILATVALPILINSKFFGFIRLDHCTEARTWDPLEIDLLNAAAAALSLHHQRSLAETALQESETRLRRQQTGLMVLAQSQFIYSGNLDAALQEITQVAANILQVERVSVWLYSPDRTQLRTRVLYHKTTRRYSQGDIIGMSEYPVYFHSLEASRVIAAEDACTDARTQELAHTYLLPYGITSKLDIPIRLGNQPIGVLSLEHIGSERSWAIEEQNFGSYLAYMTSLAMESGERASAEAERQKFVSLVENSTDFIGMSSLDGKVFYINEAGRKLVGIESTEAVLQTHISDYVAPQNWNRYQKRIFPKMLAQGDWQGETKLRHFQTGRLIEMQTSLFTVKHPQTGQPICFATVQRNITERKQAEAALLSSEHKYRSLVNQIKEVIFQQDGQGYWTFLNPAWTEMTGFSLKESIGQHWLKFVHPEDRNRCEQWIKALTKQGTEFGREEMRYLSTAGSYRWVEVQQRLQFSADGSLSGISGTLNDITDRKWIEHLQEQERATLRQIITNAPVAMAMFDRQMCYIAYSNQWLRDYHLEGHSLLGQCHYDQFPHLSAEMKSVYQRALQGEVISKPEDIFEQPDGTPLYLRWAVQPWYEAEGQVGGVVIVTQVINELVQAREQALDASRMKSEFLANMSHEIRTPMNGVIGMTELLLQTPLNEEQRDFVNTLRLSGQNLLTLINDILDFSKLEAGQMRLEMREFDVSRTVEEVVDVLSLQAEAKGVQLFCLIDPKIPLLLKGDPSRLHQVLLNLAGNAIKFTEQGEVVIEAIFVEEADLTATIRFEVRDTGIGIAPDDRTKLFQTFSQVDASTTRRYGGTGLGLAICKQLVTLMGGQIGVESVVSKGSTFWFTVCLNTEATTSVPSDVADIACRLSHLKVLVVDAHATSRHVICTYCQSWNIQCDEANNAQEAITCLRHAVSLGQPYQLVLIDLQNPATNGEMLAQLIHFDPALSQTQEIVMVSIQQHEQVQHLLQQGIAGYVLKPMKASRLLEAVMKATESQPMPQGDRACTPVRSLTLPPVAIPASLKILLVEDTPINQKVVLNQLKVLGYQADVANNGQQALDRLAQQDYDVVLMDCLMPLLDGYKTTQLLRQRESSQRHTIVIAMTANALAGEREKCLAAGMDDYLTKPVEIEKLAGVLQQWGASLAGEMPVGETETWPALTQEVSRPASTSVPVDLALLHQRCRGDRAFEQEMLEAFVEDAPAYIEQIQQAIVAKAPERLSQSAHQLKGAAAMVAIQAIPELARHLEELGRHHTVEGATALLAQIQQVMEQVAQFVQGWSAK